ncbi:methyltransferase [Stutzerimonas kirkiae]|uniref:methyltransferase n=1 Tax=Stutzerimonas kirkiae TaxID=2211392 RepID=UPI0010383EC2|nr:methyltransferase [Stutzerimonas kirkiae]TBV07518.1 SAM-dependent methyltransferase [Stutzerimonas kirkiae]
MSESLQRFLALDAFLLEHQGLWRPRPFTALHLPWEKDCPELAHWLRQRSLEDAEHTIIVEDVPAPFAELARQAERLARLQPLPSRPVAPVAARTSAHIPGRKWQQIQAFSSALQFTEKPGHWLDWCAGKGHLGRLLALDGTPLTCLEWNAALVEEGRRLSQRAGIRAQHRQQDVMAELHDGLPASYTPVALHACGDLHCRLLRVAIEQGCRQLALAPCCYNRIASDQYQPLSQAALGSALHLDKDDLGLPLSETVTAGARERRQRDQSMAWRLGFDLYQRQARQTDSYLPTPSLPSAWLRKPFEHYIRDLARLKALPEPAPQDWPALERAGWERLAQVRNLERLRNLFRRPLELWLALDRALLLEEHGYRVRLGTFCAASLTPRNLLLLAER